MQISSVFSKQPSGKFSEDMGSTVMSLPSAVHFPGSSAPLVVQQDGADGRQFKIRLADKPGTRRQAGMLVNRRYNERGYGEQEVVDLPHRLTIVAYDGDTPVGTLTIGLDGPGGLLCNELYGMEIDLLRVRGRRACEIIKLAVDASCARLHTIASLFHVAYIYAYQIHGFDDFVIEINPRHARFYKNRLGFKVLGPERMNMRVNAPAVLMHCGLPENEERIKLLGGRLEAVKDERSIFPYFFNPKEAEGIHQRLSALAMKALLVNDQ